MTTHVVRAYAGQNLAELEAEVEAWYDREIAPKVCRQGREAVARHREQGHVTALLTSGTAISTKPLQRALEIDHLVCTELEVEGGILTGRYFRPSCYGTGKVTYAEQLAKEHGLDLERSFFYTDSYSDRPMLERVGQPRVVNPDPRLRRWAKSRGFGFQKWEA
jgi:HAD superfamily hydrolase (TIGR01490 family)